MERLFSTRISSRESLLTLTIVPHLMILIHLVGGRHAKFIQSAAGEDVMKRLYSETMAEMRDYTDVPSALLARA